MKNLDESTYIYDIIDELCPPEYSTDLLLFDLDDLNEDKDANFKRRLVHKFNKAYALKWELPIKTMN